MTPYPPVFETGSICCDFIVLCCNWEDRTDKSIAALGNGFDEARPISGIAESFSQSRYRAIQTVIKIDERIGGPKRCTQLFPGNHITHLFQ